MKRVRAGLVLLVVLLLGVGGSWLALRTWTRRAAAREAAPQLAVTATVRRQDLLITVDQTGPLSAKKSESISLDISGVLLSVCDNGIMVKQGQPVATLDPVRMLREYEQLTQQLQQAERKLKQAKDSRDARITSMTIKLEQARQDEAAFKRSQDATLREQLDTLLFRSAELRERRRQLSTKERLAAKGLIPGTELERELTALKADEFSLQTQRTKLALDMSQAKARVLERRKQVQDVEADLASAQRQADTQVRMAENELESLRMRARQMAQDLKETVVRAPAAGVVVLNEDPTPGEMMWHGRELGRVVDLHDMQVVVELNQAQVVEVAIGQEVLIQVDALPEQQFRGRVTEIGKTARRPSVEGAAWWQRAETTFPVTISISKPDPRMRPGMRANVRIVTQRIKDAVVVPMECVFRRQGRPLVYVQRGKRYQPVYVQLGRSNGNYVVVRKPLQPGDRVVLNDVGRMIHPAARPPADKSQAPAAPTATVRRVEGQP